MWVAPDKVRQRSRTTTRGRLRHLLGLRRSTDSQLYHLMPNSHITLLFGQVLHVFSKTATVSFYGQDWITVQ